MSAIASLNLIGSFTVGEGGAESPAYPVIEITEESRLTGPDDRAPARERETTWVIRSLAAVPDQSNPPGQAGVSALIESLHAALVRRGQRVRVVEFGGARVMPAAGASGSLALPGWPRTSVRLMPDELTLAHYQAFELRAETRAAADSWTATGGADHDFRRETSVDSGGLSTVTQSGSVRMAPTASLSAAAWIEPNVFAPARTAATLTQNLFTTRIRESADGFYAEYEMRTAPPEAGQIGFGGAQGVSRGESSDTLSVERGGRRVRRVQGYADGAGASAWALSQRPSGAGVYVTASEISAPRLYDGRVTFSYEALDGIALGNAVLLSWTQSIAEIAGGRDAEEGRYIGGTPRLWLGAEAAYRYRQSTTAEFIGAWNAIPIAPLMAAGNLASPPRVSRAVDGVVRRISVEHEFAFQSRQSLPQPTEYFTDP